MDKNYSSQLPKQITDTNVRCVRTSIDLESSGLLGALVGAGSPEFAVQEDFGFDIAAPLLEIPDAQMAAATSRKEAVLPDLSVSLPAARNRGPRWNPRWRTMNSAAECSGLLGEAQGGLSIQDAQAMPAEQRSAGRRWEHGTEQVRLERAAGRAGSKDTGGERVRDGRERRRQ